MKWEYTAEDRNIKKAPEAQLSVFTLFWVCSSGGGIDASVMQNVICLIPDLSTSVLEQATDSQKKLRKLRLWCDFIPKSLLVIMHQWERVNADLLAFLSIEAVNDN